MTSQVGHEDQLRERHSGDGGVNDGQAYGSPLCRPDPPFGDNRSPPGRVTYRDPSWLPLVSALSRLPNRFQSLRRSPAGSL